MNFVLSAAAPPRRLRSQTIATESTKTLSQSGNPNLSPYLCVLCGNILDMTARLNVNIDHVATFGRRARLSNLRDRAARICEETGAHGITVHIRGDRRHIQDRDIEELRDAVTTYLNVEMAATDEMVAIARRIKPGRGLARARESRRGDDRGGLDVIGILRSSRKRPRE